MKNVIIILNALVFLGAMITIPTTNAYCFDYFSNWYDTTSDWGQFNTYISDLYNPTTDNRGWNCTYKLPQYYGDRSRGLTYIQGRYQPRTVGLWFPNNNFQDLWCPYIPYYDYTPGYYNYDYRPHFDFSSWLKY